LHTRAADFRHQVRRTGLCILNRLTHMANNIIKLGDPIRPEGAQNFGTIGCFARHSSGICIVTCDHVIKAFATAPENGNLKLCPPFGNSQFDIALFEGRSLCKEKSFVADIAIAKISDGLEYHINIPDSFPISNIKIIQNIDQPHKGDKIFIWGAETQKYHSALIESSQSDAAWNHSKYGEQKFRYQFSATISTESAPPDLGDSGGPVLNTNGSLVGFLAAISTSTTDSQNYVVYCVPAISCFELLEIELVQTATN
jgi:hypothetical protein